MNLCMIQRRFSTYNKTKTMHALSLRLSASHVLLIRFTCIQAGMQQERIQVRRAQPKASTVPSIRFQ
eukprot:m.132155 g.132155  ORF g.132155 m.132155 type:complete len:67 (+) comp38062_c0_seq3:529-729(+)